MYIVRITGMNILQNSKEEDVENLLVCKL